MQFDRFTHHVILRGWGSFARVCFYFALCIHANADEAKKDYRKVKEENLGLKQERQQLLERVAGLESKVLEGQIQRSVAAVEVSRLRQIVLQSLSVLISVLYFL